MSTVSSPTPTQQRSIERKVLANGTTLLYAPNPYNQIVAVRIISRFGSRHDLSSKAGMANLAMRLLSSGTETHTEGDRQFTGTEWSAFQGGSGKRLVFRRSDDHSRQSSGGFGSCSESAGLPCFLKINSKRARSGTNEYLEQEDSRLMRRSAFSSTILRHTSLRWHRIGLIETLDSIGRMIWFGIVKQHCILPNW